MKNIFKKSKKDYKIILRRVGRHKKPFYKIVVLTRANKYRFCLGSLELFSNRKIRTIFIDKTMFFFWLLKGASCSYRVYLILNYLIITDK